jgi:hypothetical protein
MSEMNFSESAGFTGNTRLITDQGLMPFDELQLGLPIRVLGNDGRWQAGIAQQLESDEIWEVELLRCGVQHIIFTTQAQLWPIQSPVARYAGYDPKCYTTEQLTTIAGSSKKKLLTINPAEFPSLDPQGVLHGIVFGDGTRHKGTNGRKPACQLYLCNDPQGADSRQLAILFQEAGYKPIVRDDYSQVRVYGLPEHWKSLPSICSTPEYLRGFIAGWFAADGHMDPRGSQANLATINKNALAWLQAAAPRAGLAVSVRIGTRSSNSTFGPATWYSIGLMKETLDEAFLLIEEKRQRLNPSAHPKYWKIVGVRPTGRVEPVFTVHSETGQFVLEGNILTGGVAPGYAG